jgi:hypothetical protein
MNRPMILASLLGLAACGQHQPAPAPGTGVAAQGQPCTATSGNLPGNIRVDALQGAYRLRLVASSGARAGDSTVADLELVPADDSLQFVSTAAGGRDSTTRLPLIGWTTLDPAAIGGAETGALDSREPTSPGVLVIERHTSRPDAPIEIMLRLGADANRRDQVLFDGSYFALTVRRIDEGGFAGSWASAAGELKATTGHFCATRAAG